jgi:DNA modification methylase
MPATAADVLAGRAAWAVECGDALEVLRALPGDAVHCCVTSPPYYGLRDYGTGRWEGGDPTCAHRSPTMRAGRNENRPMLPGSAAPTLDAYVERLVGVFREVRRVLHPSGTLWLNLGDSYSSKPPGCKGVSRSSGLNGVNSASGSYRERLEQGHGTKRDTTNIPGVKPKDLIGVPWLVAFALRADGWHLRQWAPWVKRNPMPESVTDRPGTACEVLFMLSKGPRAYYDRLAVAKPIAAATRGDRPNDGRPVGNGFPGPTTKGGGRLGSDDTRNRRNADWWFESVGPLVAEDGRLLGFDVTPQPYKGAHFAVMPPRLVEPCVLAGTSERGCCPACRAPWRRVVGRARVATRPGAKSKVYAEPPVHPDSPVREHHGDVCGRRDPQRHCTKVTTAGWKAGCDCAAGPPVPCVVLDPFAGSGTTLAVAVGLGRRAVGAELNEQYVELARQRMRTVTPALC